MTVSRRPLSAALRPRISYGDHRPAGASRPSPHLPAWLGQRQPIDWLVAGLAAMGAYVGTRPSLDARQLVMEARVHIHLEDLAAEGEGADEAEAPTNATPG